MERACYFIPALYLLFVPVSALTSICLNSMLTIAFICVLGIWYKFLELAVCVLGFCYVCSRNCMFMELRIINISHQPVFSHTCKSST